MADPLQEELRSKLTDLGIEWTSGDFMKTDDVTNWGDSFSYTTTFNGTEGWLFIRHCTPEQAIAASIQSEPIEVKPGKKVPLITLSSSCG